MLKFKITKTLILGICLTLASSGGVYASTMVAPDTPVSSPAYVGQEYDAAILKLQSEIDQFVFAQHRGEFTDKGFSVTHTGPMGDYVEIGIQPYSEENAEYLYAKFGKEKVKIVEGQFASALAAVTGLAEPAMDTPLMADVSAPVQEDSGEVQANVVSDQVDRTGEVSITAEDSGKEPAKEDSNALVYGFGAVVVLGAGALGIRRLLPQTKK